MSMTRKRRSQHEAFFKIEGGPATVENNNEGRGQNEVGRKGSSGGRVHDQGGNMKTQVLANMVL